jgi:putative CocE/NonD family hydrolase
VPVADGTKLAVDIYLPKVLPNGTRLPTVYMATRYWRPAPSGFGGGEQAASAPPSIPADWLRQGYVFVSLDVRGTGASFGQWNMPWSPQEVRDIGEIAQWIAQQVWSDGRIATAGNSYTSATAQIAAVYGGKAIKAVLARFMAFDTYTDLLFPGGIASAPLIKGWGTATRGMDTGVKSSFVSWADGPTPVDGEDGAALLAKAIKEHSGNPWSFDKAADTVTFKDDLIPPANGVPIDASGVWPYKTEIERSNVPIFGWAGWMDGGTAQSALNRYIGWKNPQLLVVGAWTHGARAPANPYAPPGATLEPSLPVQQSEFFCFLDQYLGKHPRVDADREIFYYTMGENRWKITKVWPVTGMRQNRFYLDAEHGLSRSLPRTAGVDPYDVDFEATRPQTNRWWNDGGLAKTIDYGNLATEDRRLLVYDTQTLPRDVEITGNGLVNLRITSNRTDGDFFVYLEDVAPDGKVTYVTEGELRALHRKVSSAPPAYKTLYPYHTFARADAMPLVPGQATTLKFQLLPTSVLFKAGHRIRVAIAGADAESFRREPETGDAKISVLRGGKEPSYIDLPMVSSR